jgi:hypothetical protein
MTGIPSVGMDDMSEKLKLVGAAQLKLLMEIIKGNRMTYL